MLTIALQPETEQRIAERARDRGISVAELAHILIEDALDDLEDIRVAEERLGKHRPPLTSAQARKALGLDD